MLVTWTAATPAGAQSTTLNAEQMSNIRAQLEELRMVIDGRNSELNRSAGTVFRQAAQDPKAAVELYARCYKMVHFEREDREESEYREWEDNQKDTFRDPRFLEGLQMQLRYLALSCEAAEADELKDVFPSLLAYVDGLSQLTELPGQPLLQGVDSSVFAQAYKLNELLAKNKSWEMVPFDIGGIYDKTILPYLRSNDPTRLIGAWDRRIAQQTQMVQFFSALEAKGTNRDERRTAENRARQLQQGRTGTIVKAYDEFDFQENTLPNLQWRRLRDMALHVDAVQGISGMLAFVKERTEHPRVSDWVDELTKVLEEIATAQAEAYKTTASPPAAPVAPAPAPAAATGSGGTPVIGGVPAGLE